MRRVFLDTNVFLYALGEAHHYREPCRAILDRLSRGALAGETSVKVIQEFVHVRRRRPPAEEDATTRARQIADVCDRVHDFERRDLERALELLDRDSEIRVRDAIHAATALNRDIDAILSADQHFDGFTGLDRIDPADADGVAALADPGHR